MSKKSQFEKLYNKRLYWSTKKNRLPQDLQKNYTIQLFVDETELNGQTKQKIYLNFKNKVTKQDFQIVIDDHNPPKSCMHYAEITGHRQLGYHATLKDPVEEILFTTVQNYNKVLPKIQEVQIKERKPYQSDSQIQDYLDKQLANQDFDSDDDPEPSSANNTNRERQDQSDPSIKVEVLYILKKDKFKKFKEIKAMLQQMGFTITDTKLKEILISLCGTHLMDRKKGFMIKSELLSNEQRQKRNQQLEQQQKQQLQKQSKKGTKKQSKKMTNKQIQKKSQLTSIFVGNERPTLFKPK